MKFKRKYFIGIGIGLFLLIADILFFISYGCPDPDIGCVVGEERIQFSRWFFPIMIVAGSIAWGQIWFDFFLHEKKQREIESRFLDFVRNLAGSIKSGMPIPRAIMHVAKIDYGALSPYVKKLGYQIEWSIPVHKALIYFSNSTKNDIIKRSISTVIEAEQSGGNMEDVLESITTSLIEIKKIKESRRATVHSQTVQMYIIFFVFMGVMLVIRNLLIPYINDSPTGSAFAGQSSAQVSSLMICPDIFSADTTQGMIANIFRWFTCMNGIFMMLSLIQGLFAGIIVGKLSEGDLTAGLKHSLILMTFALLVMTVIPAP